MALATRSPVDVIQCLRLVFMLQWVLYLPAAHAYIDPGSGGLLLQMVIAGVIALAFRLRGLWRGIVERLRRIFRGP
jgi:hypothetical protein